VFLSENLLFNNTKNSSRRSLLDFIVVGDVLACHCILTDYLDLSCKAIELPGKIYILNCNTMHSAYNYFYRLLSPSQYIKIYGIFGLANSIRSGPLCSKGYKH